MENNFVYLVVALPFDSGQSVPAVSEGHASIELEAVKQSMEGGASICGLWPLWRLRGHCVVVGVI